MVKKVTYGQLRKVLLSLGCQQIPSKENHFVFEEPKERSSHHASRRAGRATRPADGFVGVRRQLVGHGLLKDDEDAFDSLFLIRKGDRLIWTDPETGKEIKVTAAAGESDGLVVVKQNGSLLPCRVDQVRRIKRAATSRQEVAGWTASSRQRGVMSVEVGDAEVDVAKHDATAPTPRRTRQHVIAAMSMIHVQKAFIDKGHTVDREYEDYGYDLVAKNLRCEKDTGRTATFASRSRPRIQSDASGEEDSFSLEIKLKHYNLWMQALMPVFLILYEPGKRRPIGSTCRLTSPRIPERGPIKAAKTVTVHIPAENEFNEETIDYMRERKAAIRGVQGGSLPWLRMSHTRDCGMHWRLSVTRVS